MKRGDETGSIHGSFKLLDSLKAKNMKKMEDKKKGSIYLICQPLFLQQINSSTLFLKFSHLPLTFCLI